MLKLPNIMINYIINNHLNITKVTTDVNLPINLHSLGERFNPCDPIFIWGAYYNTQQNKTLITCKLILEKNH